ncbi:unnamed protein product [Rhizoctonia solani]|uniref:G domain-containing protein n=1 Tax=Rhizoctonia solani TaxID=456999 RepID=A0A8H3DU26_9AGAM|nr:unnamed protein product [Rhizoctonia solani]CAE7083521.1 unnamed protein product [Rhizoctonia solani]
MSDIHSGLQDVDIIVLFGATGSGKSTFANVASDDSMEVGRGLTSCTQRVEPTRMFLVDGKPVVVIDSPGFDDTYASDAEILKSVAGFLATAYTEKFKITGLIFLHKITDTRVGGKALLHMRMFRQICGIDALKNVVYVTNMWSEPPTENEVLRESELRESDQFFGMPLSHGAQMCRHNNTQESAHNIIRKVLPLPPNATALAEELVGGIPLDKTKAGKALGLGLEEEVRKLNDEIEGLREDHAQAIRENNEKHQKALAQMEQKAQADRRNLENQIASLSQGHKKQAEDWAKQLRECSASMTANAEEIARLNQARREQGAFWAKQLKECSDSVVKTTDELRNRHDKAMMKAREDEENRMKNMRDEFNVELAKARNRPRRFCIIA